MNYVERHQDYVIPIPTLPVGAVVPVQFQFEPDAPFELRGLAARTPYEQFQLIGDPVQPGRQLALQSVAMRYTDASNDWKQDQPIPLYAQMAYFGQLGSSLPRYPGLWYPANGVVSMELINFGAAPVVGLQIFFRGVKLFPAGTLRYTYPVKMARDPLPYIHGFVIPNLAVTETRLRQVWQGDTECDFVIRGGQAGLTPSLGGLGVFAGPLALEVFFTLQDESGKPYSNAPVHADVLFGRVGQSSFPCGQTPIYPTPVGIGPGAPGLFFPELYIPRNHVLYYDVYRNDAAYAVGMPTAVNYPVALHGVKVWPA